MHQNAPFIPLNIKNGLPKEGAPPLLQPPPSRPAAARVRDALSAYSCKISFYSQTYLHPWNCERNCCERIIEGGFIEDWINVRYCFVPRLI